MVEEKLQFHLHSLAKLLYSRVAIRGRRKLPWQIHSFFIFCHFWAKILKRVSGKLLRQVLKNGFYLPNLPTKICFWVFLKFQSISDWSEISLDFSQKTWARLSKMHSMSRGRIWGKNSTEKNTCKNCASFFGCLANNYHIWAKVLRQVCLNCILRDHNIVYRKKSCFVLLQSMFSNVFFWAKSHNFLSLYRNVFGRLAKLHSTCSTECFDEKYFDKELIFFN